MASVPLHPTPFVREARGLNPLPQLLQTPSGFALLELQGTVNLPRIAPDSAGGGAPVSIGRLDFPEYRPDGLDPTSTAWMKRVHLYIGQHQRLTGEMRKLPKPLAVIRRRAGTGGSTEAAADELEVVEIIKYKLVFSQRPEPVGTASHVP